MSEPIKIVLICLDGCDPSYITPSNAPSLEKAMRRGASITCESMVPTVTNLNVASILTGEFPSSHGIIGNYYFDESSGSEFYMDSPEFLMCRTLLEKASSKGRKTLFLAVKEKLRKLFCRGATTSFSVENPPEPIIRDFGEPPGIYSPDASIWLLDLSIKMLDENPYDLAFIVTTDFVSHKFGPKNSEAREYMKKIDDRVKLLMEKNFIVGVTADHGMSDKSVKIDLEKSLVEKGVWAKVIPAIKDEYIIHHQNLGGAAYVYTSRDNLKKISSILSDLEGVEHVIKKEEASQRYMLPKKRIGELLVLGDKDSVFGPVEKGLYEDVKLRSHGSLHEREVFFITNLEVDARQIKFNKDVFPYLLGKLD